MDKSAIKSVSVVIPVKNGENTIGKCLAAIFNQTYKPLEVIIVDGHSKDRTIEIAKTYQVRIIYENFGKVGGARQVGLENARANYIAFTDADCCPQPDWLKNLIEEFDANAVGIGGGTRNIGIGLWEKSIALALNSFLGSANSVQDRLFNEKRIVKSISGCNSMYRKSDLIEIGGFNTKLSMNEDTELNNKIRKIGKLIYIPNAIVLHYQNRNLRDFAKRMYQYGYGRSNNRLWDIQVLPPIFAVLLLASLILTPKLVFIMLFVYIIILGSMAIKFSIRERDLKYLFSIPIIYILEHVSYTIGFWKGLFE